MTKISNQYSLTNILTADLANSRLGINNVSPTVALDVTGAGKFSSSVTAGGALLVSYANARASITSTTATNSSYLSFTNTTNGYIGLDNSAGTDFGNGAYSLNLINGGAYNLNLGTSNITRLTITSAGNVGIGTDTPSALLTVSSIGFDDTFFRVEQRRSGYAAAINLVGATDSGAIYNRISSQTNGGTTHWQIGGGGVASTMLMYTGGTERMRITAAGNVGIGTTSPTAIGTGYLSLTTNGVNGGGLVMQVNGTATSYIYAESGALVLNNTSGIMQFYNAGTERMRITSGGQVGVATTTISSAFNMQVGNNAGVIATTVLRLQNSYLEGTTGYYGAQITAVDNGVDGHNLQFQTRANASSGFSTRMTITTTGNIGAPSGTNIYNASDIRLKQNISKTTYGLDTISALNPVKFNWVDGFEPSEDGKDMLGFVAQEVQQVIPEAVELFGGDINLNGEIITTPLRVNEKFIIPVLVKAIQELSAKVSLLENK